ncbi:MAG: leucine-rich repeat domain-containing protein [Ruminococcaceae bacterium]|nr:leucine-rich repeat domain-containing protein [Oscillospiraceae bacterium]
MKKFLSFALAFIMLLSGFSVSSFVSMAEEVTEESVSPNESENTEQAVSFETEAATGETPDVIEEELTTAEEPAPEEDTGRESGVVNEELAGVVAKGLCGDNIKYTLSNHTLILSGTGSTYDYEYTSYIPWYDHIDDYYDYITAVVVEEGITRIGKNLFHGYRRLNSVSLPSTLKEIGPTCFGNSNFSNITLNDGLETIGESAFEYCKKLEKIIIPDTVETIGSNAFNRCQTNIQLGAGIKYIGANAFHFGFSKEITELVIPEGVEYIGSEAFMGCYFTTVTIPDSVYFIGGAAFRICYKLESMFIGKNVENIYCTIVEDSPKFKEFIVSDDNSFYTSHDGILYDKEMETLLVYPIAKTDSNEFTVPNGVKVIGRYSFENNCFLEKVKFPDSLEIITACAFYNNDLLNNIVIPDSVTTIGASAFENCGSLSEVELGNGIRVIESRAFVGTPAFTNGIDENDIVYIDDYLIIARNDVEGEITVKPGTIGIAHEAFAEELFITKILLPDSLKYIGNKSFYNSSIEKIEFSNGVEYIGSYAFYNCNYLTEISIPSSVKEIGDSAFSNCSSLTQIDLEEGLKKIGNYAFAATNITEITLPKTVTSIGSSVFYNCDSLKRAVVLGELTILTTSLFENCDLLEEVVLPSKLTSIYNYCFYKCISLKSFTVPSGVVEIGSYAFASCSSLTDIIIPDSVTNIDSKAFNSSKNVRIKCFPESYAEIFAKTNKIPYDIVCNKCYALCQTEDTLREANCMQTGLKLYLYSCGDYTIKVHNKTAHSFKNYTYNNDATCTEDGTQTAYCEYGCGTFDTIVSNIRAHCFTEYVYNNDATCTSDGTQTALCDYGCGTNNTITAPNTKLEHTYKADIIYEADCKHTGMILYKCHCNYYYTEIIPTTGIHVGEWEVTVEPTVNSEGEKTRVCTLCGANEKKSIAKIEVPVLDIQNYNVSISSAEYIKYIRYAYGEYSTSAEIKNASDCITLNQRNVLERTSGGIAKLEMEKGGYYSFWIKLTDGSEYVYLADLTVMHQSVSVEADCVTVRDLYGVKDFFIAYGEHDNYRAVKDDLLVQVTSKKIGASRNYSYMIHESGIYTLCVRYDDSTREYSFVTFEVVLPEVVFTGNGSQLNVSGIDDVKVIRFAYGEYKSTGEIKRAENSVSYSGKGRLKGLNEYTLSFTNQGPVSVSVIFNSGYSVIYQYNY